jgi:hypothetical protein
LIGRDPDPAVRAHIGMDDCAEFAPGGGAKSPAPNSIRKIS